MGEDHQNREPPLSLNLKRPFPYKNLQDLRSDPVDDFTLLTVVEATARVTIRSAKGDVQIKTINDHFLQWLINIYHDGRFA